MNEKVYIPIDEITDWGKKVFLKTGLSESEADCVMDVLKSATLRGVDTHGVYLIPRYANVALELKRGKMFIAEENETTCVIDGNDELGQIVAVKAMEKTIEIAGKKGVGVTVVRNSNHFGPCCHYSMMAPPHDMIGFATTVGTDCMAPWGGNRSLTGNNPISVAMPGIEFPIVLDMALSGTAVNKVKIYARDNKPMPIGWGLDKDGKPTTDASKVEFMAPIGDYKGVNLAIIIELICGILSRGAFARGIAKMGEYSKARKIPHMFMAMRISDFVDMDYYYSRLKEYIEDFRSCGEAGSIYLPGEKEYLISCQRIREGVPCEANLILQFNEIADKVGARHIL